MSDGTNLWTLTSPLRLQDMAAGVPEGVSREDVAAKTQSLVQDVADQQCLLFAEGKHRVLALFQGMDTAGKNGTIKKVFFLTDPNGVRVAAFRKPTTNELARDFLWRVHAQVPRTGELAIFNRSHYEDVVSARVVGGVSEAQCRQRYGHINAFERLLVEEGTLVLKFFLHIDKEEQRRRLQKRIDNPKKHWKLDPADFEDRQRWEKYEQAYEQALEATHTDIAPWHIIPSNAKWYRNYCVAAVVVEHLLRLKMSYPQPSFDPHQFPL